MVAQAPVFVNNGLIVDDWWIFRIKPGYPTQINFLLYGAGHPIAYALALVDGAEISYRDYHTLLPPSMMRFCPVM